MPGERISIEIADQSNERDLQRIASLGPFDIVSDDGSHFWKHPFQILVPAVRPGGFYILEDLDTSHGQHVATYRSGGISAASYLYQLCDRVVSRDKSFTMAISIRACARSGQRYTWFSDKAPP